MLNTQIGNGKQSNNNSKQNMDNKYNSDGINECFMNRNRVDNQYEIYLNQQQTEYQQKQIEMHEKQYIEE